MTDTHFHMPICRAPSIFERQTREAINTFIDAKHIHLDLCIIGVVTDYQIYHNDRQLIIPHAIIDLVGETEDGRIETASPRFFKDPKLFQAYGQLAAAITTDMRASQASGWLLPIPKNPQQNDPVLGQLYRHIQFRHFAMFGREYPATAAHSFGRKILGPKPQDDMRRYYMNLLLPPAESAHERIEEAKSYARISDLAPRVYDMEMDGEEDAPLAPLNFQTVTDLS